MPGSAKRPSRWDTISFTLRVPSAVGNDHSESSVGKIAILQSSKAEAELQPQDRGGGLAGILPIGGTRVFVARADDAKAGDWSSVEGQAFYSEGLQPGTYDVYLHFGNCCGMSQRVNVETGRLSVVRFTIARYYTQTFASLTANSYYRV